MSLKPAKATKQDPILKKNSFFSTLLVQCVCVFTYICVYMYTYMCKYIYCTYVCVIGLVERITVPFDCFCFFFFSEK